MSTIRALTAFTALVVGCAACGTDLALEEPTPSAPLPSTSPAPEATATPEPTSSASPTAPATPEPTSGLGAPTPPATAGVDYHDPSGPEVLGTGLVEGFTLDGSGLLVNEELPGDDTLGCEGAPPPVLQRIELAGGDKQVAIDDVDAYGILSRDGAGRLIITTQCEGFLVAQFLADESPDGEVTVAGEVPYGPSAPAAVRSTELLAGSANATIVLADDLGTSSGQVGSLDPQSGEIEILLEGDYVDAAAVFGRQLLVTSSTGEVMLLDADLEPRQRWEARAAFVSPDRTAGLLVDGGDIWLVEFATGLTALVGTVDDPVRDLAWSPDGSAALVVTESAGGAVLMVGLDGRITEIAGPGSFARPAFSPAGDAVAFNDLSDPDGDFRYDAVLVTFG